jgi:Putative carbohydrate metabolism domain/Secretion system C-terminal sorting domain
MSKQLYLILALAILTSNVSAQSPIPNGGFENWSFAFPPLLFSDPNSWGSSDKVIQGVSFKDPKLVQKETASGYVYAGSSSLRLHTDTTSISIPGLPFSIPLTLPGFVSLGDLSVNLLTQQLNNHGIAYTSRPDSLQFAYRYETDSNNADSGTVTATLTLTQPAGNATIANVSIKVGATTGWVVKTVKLDYNSQLAPDSLVVQASSANGLQFFGAKLGSTLWLDALKFKGLDTVFRVYISPAGSRAVCSADSFKLHTDSVVGYTYQWYYNSAAITGATLPSYAVHNNSGSYHVMVTSNGSTLSSDTIIITVNPSPVVTLSGNPDSICRSSAPITLTGGSPTGGRYSINNGATTTQLNPANLQGGINLIRYSARLGQCTSRASEPVFVDTGLAITQTGLPDTISGVFALTSGIPTGGYYTIGRNSTTAVTSIDPALYGDSIRAYYHVINASGCINNASHIVHIKRISAVIDVAGSIYRIYPNPATDYITIESGSDIPVQAVLTDLQGKSLIQTAVAKGRTQMNTQHIATGTYLLHLSGTNGEHLSTTKTLITNR